MIRFNYLSIVSELRAALAERDLPTDGLKADLVSRLQARLDEEEFGMDDDIAVPAPATTTMKKDEPKKATEKSKPVTDTKVIDSKAEEKKEASELDTEVAEKSVSQEVTSSQVTTSGGMTMEEKMKARAERFNIPLAIPTEKKKQQPANAGKGKKQEKKRGRDSHSEKEGAKKQKNDKKNDKKNKQGEESKKMAEEKKPEPLLPKEEILKRLERAKKFGASNIQQIDALKAMLRRHRFG